MVRKDLRRRLDAGIPLNVVQAALGHADLKTTQRYLTMDGASLAGMFDSIGLGEGKEG